MPGHVVLLALGILVVGFSPGQAQSDGDLKSAFRRVVFGSEFASGSSQANVVKKFAGPVRFYIDDRAGDPAARSEAREFLHALSLDLPILHASIVDAAGNANFGVLLLRRARYDDIVTREVLGRVAGNERVPDRPPPGECLVRIVASPVGIIRSDAVIAVDASDGLFRKCLIAEILQGLGPINDDPRLQGSVFNDSTRIATFTPLDRMILSLLYHPDIRAGMRQGEVDARLPAIIRDIRSKPAVR